jgi:glycosyltransferase involved in cell wall biosynthesis
MPNSLGTRKEAEAVSKIEKGVCVVTFPLGKSNYAPFLHLVDILRPRSRRLYILSGGGAKEILEAKGVGKVVSIRHESYSGPLKRAASYALTNLRFLAKVIELRKRVGLFVFFLGAESLLIPMLGAKLLRVKTVVMLAGDPGLNSLSRGDPLGRTIPVITAANFFLADVLVLYSKGTMEGVPFGRYRSKVFIGHEQFVDLEEFGPRTEFQTRAQTVGFVGRLDREKGVLNLVQAIPMVLGKVPAEFVMCGDGPLRSQIADYLGSHGLSGSVKMEGWINHAAIPGYLNQFRLLVLPSNAEGIANAALEAMACGTPVLMTKVGALAEMATDGKEIFYLDSNDPREIADKIVSVLADASRLQQVSDAAVRFVRTRFSYQSTSEIWDSLFSRLNAASARSQADKEGNTGR